VGGKEILRELGRPNDLLVVVVHCGSISECLLNPKEIPYLRDSDWQGQGRDGSELFKPRESDARSKPLIGRFMLAFLSIFEYFCFVFLVFFQKRKTEKYSKKYL
jgi:hypothetical protein